MAEGDEAGRSKKQVKCYRVEAKDDHAGQEMHVMLTGVYQHEAEKEDEI
jgi:hypothetical protein